VWKALDYPSVRVLEHGWGATGCLSIRFPIIAQTTYLESLRECKTIFLADFYGLNNFLFSISFPNDKRLENVLSCHNFWGRTTRFRWSFNFTVTLQTITMNGRNNLNPQLYLRGKFLLTEIDLLTFQHIRKGTSRQRFSHRILPHLLFSWVCQKVITASWSNFAFFNF